MVLRQNPLYFVLYTPGLSTARLAGPVLSPSLSPSPDPAPSTAILITALTATSAAAVFLLAASLVTYFCITHYHKQAAGRRGNIDSTQAAGRRGNTDSKQPSIETQPLGGDQDITVATRSLGDQDITIATRSLGDQAVSVVTDSNAVFDSGYRSGPCLPCDRESLLSVEFGRINERFKRVAFSAQEQSVRV